jgi:hypothetical protein
VRTNLSQERMLIACAQEAELVLGRQLRLPGLCWVAVMVGRGQVSDNVREWIRGEDLIFAAHDRTWRADRGQRAWSGPGEILVKLRPSRELGWTAAEAGIPYRQGKSSVEPRGLEPLTPCLQSKCATYCAMAPRSLSALVGGFWP